MKTTNVDRLPPKYAAPACGLKPPSLPYYRLLGVAKPVKDANGFWMYSLEDIEAIRQHREQRRKGAARG